MRLTYRMQTKEDRDELIRLWSEHSGWDVLDRKDWEHRFLKTPFGEAAITLAIDQEAGTIAGQCIFIPTITFAGGREIRSYRTFAPLLHQDLRGLTLLNPLRHPLYRMYKFATDFFARNGVGLVHSIPDPRWLRAFQLLPNFQVGKFPLWSLQLPLKEPFEISREFEVRDIRPDDPGLDELWEKAQDFYDCAIVRNSKMLPWKTSHGEYFYRGIFRQGALAGFVASVFKERDKQWLICDIPATGPEALETAIRAACNAANEFHLKNPSKPVNKAAILATEKLLPAVQKLGFYRDEYDFPFVVHLLDKSISKETVSPGRWYLSAND